MSAQFEYGSYGTDVVITDDELFNIFNPFGMIIEIPQT